MDPIDKALKAMWNGVPNPRFDTADGLEWAVAIHGALTGSVIDFVFEMPKAELTDGLAVKCHFLVKQGHIYYDHRGRHDTSSWDSDRMIVQRVTPSVVRAMTIGGSLSIPGQKSFSRSVPFNEVLCGYIAQEFLYHHKTSLVEDRADFLGYGAESPESQTLQHPPQAGPSGASS